MATVQIADDVERIQERFDAARAEVGKVLVGQHGRVRVGSPATLGERTLPSGASATGSDATRDELNNDADSKAAAPGHPDAALSY